MENVIIAAQFFIDGNWVTIDGMWPKMVQDYDTCKELAANVAEYLRSNPHPTATDVIVGCYTLVPDTLQYGVGDNL